jgi:hypothetical protein
MAHRNSLTLEERMQVELSLLELIKKEDFEDLLFLGKSKASPGTTSSEWD